MNKQEFISKIEEMRENGGGDLRTVLFFAEQLEEQKENTKNYKQEIRKQVCDEIKQEIKSLADMLISYTVDINDETVKNISNKIEKTIAYKTEEDNE